MVDELHGVRRRYNDLQRKESLRTPDVGACDKVEVTVLHHDEGDITPNQQASVCTFRSLPCQ
jgi:hypothetical protein